MDLRKMVAVQNYSLLLFHFRRSQVKEDKNRHPGGREDKISTNHCNDSKQQNIRKRFHPGTMNTTIFDYSP